jgi:hypothetical protein
MKWFDRIFEDYRLRFLVLSIVSILAYFPAIIAPQTVSPDAYFILPLFDRMFDLKGYFEFLINLKTIDIQPVRDLSLLIDWRIFKHTGFNTFIIQNVILWVISCFFIIRVLEELFPKIGSKAPFIIGLCYCVYPLFSGSVSWSIARKHILALLFIVLATHQFLKFLKNNHSKHLVYMNLWYLLGIFSQPIGILWPLWAFTYVFFFHKEKWSSFKKGFWPLILIFVFGFIVQYAYYVKSDLFSSIFASKTAETFNFELKFYAFAHYMYQIFAPYSLAFPYAHTLTTIWLGCIFLTLFISIFFILKLPVKQLGVWLLFGFLPLAIILNTPRLLLDPYLLIPSFAFLVLLTMIYERLQWKWLKFIPVPLLIFWVFETHNDSRVWTNDAYFSERNFERVPICINATRLVRSLYSENKKMTPEVRDFLTKNTCFGAESRYAELEHMVFLSQVIYFEDTPGTEEKIRILESMGKDFFYPKLVHAALMLKLNKEEEALQLIKEVVNKEGHLILDTAADPIIPIAIHPFCEKINYLGCLRITKQVKLKRDTPYF